MGVNQAATAFDIPKTTLKRRLASNNTEKTDRLGPDSMSSWKKLERVLIENNLLDKPGNIYNIDETGLQLNTGEAGQCLQKRDLKTCLPEKSKDEWLEGIPPGSKIQMSEKSAYVTSEIFLNWMTTHFFPRKSSGKVLLIVDGHSSHTTNIATLEFAEEHDIILFCFASSLHTLLAAVRSRIYKSLKSHYYDVFRRTIKNNPSKNLNRLQFGRILGEAWGSSSTIVNSENDITQQIPCTVVLLFRIPPDQVHLEYNVLHKKPTERRTYETPGTALKEIPVNGEQTFWSNDDLRSLAYELAERNGLPRFDKATCLAGQDRVKGFLKNASYLTIRTPENTSGARAMGFNKVAVSQFFPLFLSEVIDKHKLTAEKIFNCDETGVSVNPKS
ncbi:hypothetical protein NQ318_004530 [Aromia moschata]|uniref:DDE-1 domain-containing protein n=1 Tax=Aromia moschata TaxID=1265417 RepID=A0AAV8X1F4_9CUCU|nr:hypothetical protein NQ318_004530 [Aromia moschata]